MAAGQLPNHRLALFFARDKSRFQTVGVPIPAHHHLFDVRFLVQDLSAQLVVGNHPVVAVVLQGAAAHLEPCRYLLVRQELFFTWRSLVVSAHSFDAFKQGIQLSYKADFQFLVGKNNSFINCSIYSVFSGSLNFTCQMVLSRHAVSLRLSSTSRTIL